MQGVYIRYVAYVTGPIFLGKTFMHVVQVGDQSLRYLALFCPSLLLVRTCLPARCLVVMAALAAPCCC